jgi:hypothetical protein
LPITTLPLNTRGAPVTVYGFAWIDDRVLLPHDLAGDGIERSQPSVERAGKYLAVVERHAAVDHVAAALVADRARHLRVEGPQAATGTHVDRVHDAPRRGDIHDTVDHQRRRFNAPFRLEIVGPDEAELADVAGIDLFQATETRLRVIETIGRPVLRAVRVRGDGLRIDAGRRGCRKRRLKDKRWLEKPGAARSADVQPSFFSRVTFLISPETGHAGRATPRYVPVRPVKLLKYQCCEMATGGLGIQRVIEAWRNVGQ